MGDVHLVFDSGSHDPDDDPDREPPSERERWYDEHVAPKLLELARECQARGMSFVCVVEYEPGGTSETTTLAPDAGAKARMAWWGVRARGNADALIDTMLRDAERNGHGSAYLRMLGARPNPTEARP